VQSENLTTPSQSNRELYILNIKHGLGRARLYLSGPAGSEGMAAFEAARALAFQEAEQSSDVADFKRRAQQIFAAHDFHPCDK
jgi:hypothetical protein